MPSSFSWVVSSTLGCSPHPPVSVYGTGSLAAPLGGFPGTGMYSSDSGRSPPPVGSLGHVAGGFASLPPYAPSATRPSEAVYCSMRRPVGRTPRGRPGNLDPVPIGYASRPRLRSRLTPGRLTLPGKPWIFGARAFHPRFRILMPAFSFPVPPAGIATRLPRPAERSPTAPCGAHDFGDALSPDNFGRGTARPVSYYAFFKG